VTTDTFGNTDLFVWDNASPEETIECLKNAYDFFDEHSVKESYKIFALKIIAKYLTHVGFPRDQRALNASALYVVYRLPASYPNHMSKREFADRLNVTEKSLDWYSNSIVERLEFFTLRDKKNFPYYVERDGTVYAVITSVVKVFVEEAIVQGWVDIRPFDIKNIVSQILDMLINKLRIVPSAFRKDLAKKIEADLHDRFSSVVI
jgi:hypothetical protein